jgi:hypothetical protein
LGECSLGTSERDSKTLRRCINTFGVPLCRFFDPTVAVWLQCLPSSSISGSLNKLSNTFRQRHCPRLTPCHIKTSHDDDRESPTLSTNAQDKQSTINTRAPARPSLRSVYQTLYQAYYSTSQQATPRSKPQCIFSRSRSPSAPWQLSRSPTPA